MDDRRLDAALDGLAKNVPRPPEMSVDAMTRTVKALTPNAHAERLLTERLLLPETKTYHPVPRSKSRGLRRYFDHF